MSRHPIYCIALGVIVALSCTGPTLAGGNKNRKGGNKTQQKKTVVNPKGKVTKLGEARKGTTQLGQAPKGLITISRGRKGVRRLGQYRPNTTKIGSSNDLGTLQQRHAAAFPPQPKPAKQKPAPRAKANQKQNAAKGAQKQVVAKVDEEVAVVVGDEDDVALPPEPVIPQ